METGVSLGTNLGDRLANLIRARREIAGLPGVRITGQGRVWETEPVGVAPEHRARLFLNTVLVVECASEPAAFAADLRRIEDTMGRVRTADRNAPRVIDLDLLYADGLRIASPDLTVPHARLFERRFVLQPLCDVRPDLILPGRTAPVRDLLLALPESPKVVLFRAEW
jgi:2-amino-4-hydroxy-6-hydroxymethyldihydropteridine diphosphokinase